MANQARFILKMYLCKRGVDHIEIEGRPSAVPSDADNRLITGSVIL